MTPQPVQRNAALDIARGIGILLVVYGHSIEPFADVPSQASAAALFKWQVIYAFHMPLFFFLSGAVSKDRGLRHAVAGSLSLIFICYVVHFSIWVISLAGHGPYVPTASNLLYPFFTLTEFFGSIIWFLAALAIVQLISYAIMQPGRAKSTLIWLVLACGFLGAQVFSRNHYYIGILLAAVCFYLLGQRFGKSFRFPANKASLWLMAFMALGVSAMASQLNRGCKLNPLRQCFNKPDGFGARMVFGELGFFPIFVAGALAGIVAVIFLSKALADGGSRFNRPLAWAGAHSLEILVINCFFFTFILPIVNRHLLTDTRGTASAIGIALLSTAAQLLVAVIARPLLMHLPRQTRRLALYLTKANKVAAAAPAR